MYTARSLSGAGACPRCGATGGDIQVVKAEVARSIARRLDPHRTATDSCRAVLPDAALQYSGGREARPRRMAPRARMGEVTRSSRHLAFE